MTEPVWIDPNDCRIGWLTSSTPPGLFSLLSTRTPSLVWVIDGRHKAAITLTDERGGFSSVQLYDNGGSYPGVYLGAVKLTVDALSFARIDGHVNPGELVIDGAGFELAYRHDHPGFAPRRVSISALAENTGFPYEYRCLRWALLLQDQHAEWRIAFRRREPEAAA